MRKISCILEVFLIIFVLKLNLKVNEAASNKPESKRLICYYTNWAQYRQEGGKFTPDNIDPNLCTHIIYAFAKLENYKLAATEINDVKINDGKGYYQKTTDLKLKNPNLKVFLSVGGTGQGATNFSIMLHNNSLRSEFVRTAIIFLNKYNFDGLDLDLQYPAVGNGSKPDEKQLYTKLCAELKREFIPFNYSLSAAVSGIKTFIDQAYEIAEISKYLDFVSITAYDLQRSLNGFHSDVTVHHSALYAGDDVTDPKQMVLNGDFAATYWIKNGFPKEKINLGIPLYGRTFTLSSPTGNNIGSFVQGPGLAGNYSGESGVLSYYEVCEKLQSGWRRKWDNTRKVSYAFNRNQWVGFDDKDSLKSKTDYIKNKGIGGAMIWEISFDDFNGRFCKQGKYPLLNSIKDNLLVSI